jgi:hypothetical protein
MLVIKAYSTSVNIKEILKEAEKFSEDNQCGVEVEVNGKQIEIFPWSDIYEVYEEYKNGYYD